MQFDTLTTGEARHYTVGGGSTASGGQQAHRGEVMKSGSDIKIKHDIGNALQRKSSNSIARNMPRYCLAGALALISAGCVSEQSRVQETEQMLVAAGFIEKPASTPDRQNQLATLPPYKILSQEIHVGNGDTYGYVYADPQYCHCLFVGDAKAYQQYQQIALQKKIADEQLQAAEMTENAYFDWGMWGPYDWWGPGPIVVIHDGHGGPRRR